MLNSLNKKYKIILASGSPRRQQFFKDLDLDFEIRLKDIEEIYPENLQGVEITNFLAKLKANALAVFSFGKTLHVTGWKMGYIVGAERLMKEFRKVSVEESKK